MVQPKMNNEYWWMLHYNDVAWALWRLKSSLCQLYVQQLVQHTNRVVVAFNWHIPSLVSLTSHRVNVHFMVSTWFPTFLTFTFPFMTPPIYQIYYTSAKYRKDAKIYCRVLWLGKIIERFQSQLNSFIAKPWLYGLKNILQGQNHCVL